MKLETDRHGGIFDNEELRYAICKRWNFAPTSAGSSPSGTMLVGSSFSIATRMIEFVFNKLNYCEFVSSTWLSFPLYVFTGKCTVGIKRQHAEGGSVA